MRGYIEVDDEEITKFYTDATLTTQVTIPDEGYNGDMWVQLAKPPVRNTSLTAAHRFAIDNTALTVSETGTDPSNPITGKIKLSATNFSDDDIEISYFGSDSFYIEVDHGPIQNMEDVEIVVPIIDTDDSEDSTDKLMIISFSDGVDDACQDCRIRIGVFTMPTDRDDPTPLDPRISVLGVSYEGSERFALTRNYSSGERFDVTLDFDPVNVDEDKIGGKDNFNNDIVIVAKSDNFGADPTIESVEGDSVTLRLVDDALSGATIDLAYALRVGANPRNALIPDAIERPIIAVAAGSRVAFTSDNDRATVDAEIDGPCVRQPQPKPHGRNRR